MAGRGLLEVRHLRMVDAIVRERSVTAAAATLHLSQSALSHQLLNLERDFGAALFLRVGKRMIPTPAGERLAASARRVLGELHDAEAALRCKDSDRRVPLRAAAGCATLYAWLASALGRYAGAARDVDARIVFDARGREADALMRGEIDVAITSRPPEDRRLARRPLWSLATVAVTAQERGAQTRRDLRWRELAGRTLLIHDLPGGDEATLRAAVGAPVQICRVQLTEAIYELARLGQGVGLVTAGPQDLSLPEGVAAHTLRPLHQRMFWAVWRDSAAPVASAFADFVQADGPAAVAQAS